MTMMMMPMLMSFAEAAAASADERFYTLFRVFWSVCSDCVLVAELLL